MAARFLVVLCASALLVQAITAYPGCGCGVSSAGTLANAAAAANAGALANAGVLAAANANANLAAAELAAASNFGFGYPLSSFAPGPVYTGSIIPTPSVASANGGPFSVTLTSAYAPTGISVVSENTIEGFLEAIGSLPVFAAVTLDGTVGSSGAAGTSYSCGNGNVGISSESLAAAGFGVGGAIANDVARAEIAGAQLANAAGYGAALAGAGLAAYPQSALYPASAGLNAAIIGAELNAAAGLRRPCGCY